MGFSFNWQPIQKESRSKDERGKKTNTNEKSRGKERKGIKLEEKVREKKSGSGTHKA